MNKRQLSTLFSRLSVNKPELRSSLLAALCSTALLFGCQFNGLQKPSGTPIPYQQHKSNPESFSRYYLSLKKLSATELLDEIEQLSQQKKQLKKQQQDQATAGQSTDTDIYLLLLISLPSSPIYNPYNAKDLLNQLPVEVLSPAHLSSEDLAFLLLLKDQLNEQLFALSRITALEQEQALSQQKFSQQLSGLQSSLTELQQKLTQLKKIETAIDKHGQ